MALARKHTSGQAVAGAGSPHSELEVDREKAWAEAQRLATVWERQNRYIHQQNQRIAELEAQLRSGR